MAISSASGFSIGSSDAIDDRLVLTKVQMKSANDNVFPDVYMCVCSDDGNIYTYNKTNTVDETTGKFRIFESGGGLPEPESKDKLLLSSENETTSELEWKQVDKSEVGSTEWTGTKAEWEALSTEEKAKYDGKKLNFTDSEGENLIDDTAPANNKVYSSSKVESLLTGIGTIYRANWTKTEASEVNEDLTEELTLGKGNYILIAQIPFVNAVDGVRLYSIYNKTDFIYESFAMSQYSYASFLAVISIDSTKTYAIKDSGGAVSTGYDARYIDRGYLKAIKLDA